MPRHFPRCRPLSYSWNSGGGSAASQTGSPLHIRYGCRQTPCVPLPGERTCRSAPVTACVSVPVPKRTPSYPEQPSTGSSGCETSARSWICWSAYTAHSSSGSSRSLLPEVLSAGFGRACRCQNYAEFGITQTRAASLPVMSTWNS